MADVQEFVRKCKKCQENENFYKALAEELSSMLASPTFFLVGSRPFGAVLGSFGVEAEPLANISSANCRKFLWEQVISRFGIPKIVVSDNGTQFSDKRFREFLSGLGIRQKFSSVEHPQSNSQAKVANKVILNELEKCLDQRKGSWSDELASVLWSYRTMLQSSTRETPFRLTYWVDVVILVKIGEPIPKLLLGSGSEAIEKDLIDETRKMVHLSEVALKQRIALRYNRKVLNKNFEEGDLVFDVGQFCIG
ncbi:uncharacterized protein [Arachis hypogaea]|uniref:uncharacterized protein n=1 Tax=Arachis hypogaea TaxID=3818 RepID=UPI000DEDA178|nr:uncharacterized protein LOC112769811 [Arachis hypogaea]